MSKADGIGPKIVISDDARAHLLGFAESFVAPAFVDRWKHILVEKPSKALENLVRFERQLHPARCRLLEHETRDVFLATHARTKGLMFDGHDSPALMTLDEACRGSSDAVFSITPGVHAVFIFHEGWVWECKK